MRGLSAFLLAAAWLATGSVLHDAAADPADDATLVQLQTVVASVAVVADLLARGDPSGAQQTLGEMRARLPGVVAHIGAQAKQAGANATRCQLANEALLRRGGELDQSIRAKSAELGATGADLTSLDGQLAGLRRTYDAEVAHEKLLNGEYLRLRRKAEEAAEKWWEFWRSFDVVFSGDLSKLEAQRKKVNNSRLVINTRATEYNAKVAVYQRIATEKATLERSLAELRSAQAVAGGRQEAAVRSAGRLRDLSANLELVVDALSKGSASSIDSLDKLASHLSSSFDNDVIAQIRNRQIDELRQKLGGDNQSLRQLFADLAATPAC